MIELKLSSQRVNLNITPVNFLLGPKIPTPQGAAIKDAERRDTTMAYRRYRRHPVDWIFDNKWLSLAVVLLAVLIVGVPSTISYNTFRERTVIVCDKERTATSGDAEYRIYTSEGTFVMKDIMLAGTRFDTADAYGKLKEDKPYRLTYKGWRIPFLSMFPNIVEAEPLPEGSTISGTC